MSARRPSASSSPRPSANGARTKRTWQGTSAASSAKRSSATGSRSIPTSRPSGPRRSATTRACPPAPKVQSTATSPGRGSSASMSSPARTGTWTVVMSSSVAMSLSEPRGDLRHVGDDVAVVGVPLLPLPDLEALARAHERDLAVDPRVVLEIAREHHPPGAAELGGRRVRREVARELALVRRQRVAPGEDRGRPGVVVLGAPEAHAALEPGSEGDPIGEGRAVLGRNRQAVLRVEGEVEGSAEGQGASRAVPGEGPGRAEVAGWEEPCHPGCPNWLERHGTPLHPTLQHNCRPISHLP